MGLMTLSVTPGTLTGLGAARTPRPDATPGIVICSTHGYAHAQCAHVSRGPGLLCACVAVDFCCPFFFLFFIFSALRGVKG